VRRIFHIVAVVLLCSACAHAPPQPCVCADYGVFVTYWPLPEHPQSPGAYELRTAITH